MASRKINPAAAAARKAEAEKLAKMGEQEKKLYIQKKRREQAAKTATIRVRRALRAIKGMEQLARKKAYFTPEETAKIISVVNDAWKRAAERWTNAAKVSQEEEFSL